MLAALAKQQKRLEAFAGATGTVLFFEDDASLEASAKRNPGMASQFSPWSLQSSGIAQGNVWNALAAAGYGANLQHVIPSTSPLAAAELLKLPATWRIHAELVFGSPEGPAHAKTYIDDATRFQTFGSSSD
ncbi:FATTY ACID REPRESSION MUTANT PROTEIN 2-RELATED [Ceraceosorus bombacis]|uniref:FATTY ACID REPRESSION MUTANT PROTEIN 2-RELATED n=1 Tax=Ceraceosorus bombacis TaxID=401625 RepID=A0A0P1BG31_9BASI|nr:FATTY ACID REPRESSION MUTANT PROTEIN 2-RELATED [Ceraceosorus bombacis]